MDNFEIELNYKGVGELLKSKELASFCEKTASNMTAKTGMPYVAETYTAKTRVVSETHPPKDENN